jgi:hypothetical protein
MHDEDSRVGLTDAQERERSRLLGTRYSIPSVRRNITSANDDDDADMSEVYKGWIEAGVSPVHADGMLMYWQNRMLASTPWDDRNMTHEVRDWWKRRGWWKRNGVDILAVHVSPPCIGDGSGSPWTEEQRGWPLQGGGSSSSTRERELGEEYIHGEGESLDEVLQEQQSPGWYFGPGGPGGHNDEID